MGEQHEWFMGEVVSLMSIGTRMQWVDLDDAIDRLHCNTFLGRWHGPDREGDRIAFCQMNDDGDIYALGDDAAEDEPSNPSWRPADPDQLLVPVDGWNENLPPIA